MALLRMGFLPNGLKRRLGAVSGKVNGCTYCTSHDCSILKNAPGSGSEGWSMTHEELTQLLRGDDEPGNEMERACFDFVRAASQNRRMNFTAVLRRISRLRNCRAASSD